MFLHVVIMAVIITNIYAYFMLLFNFNMVRITKIMYLDLRLLKDLTAKKRKSDLR